MKVLDLLDIQREESFLYYRRKFTASACIELPINIVHLPLNFTIEAGPTGKKDIDIEIKGDIDYPLIPLINRLKECISAYDKEGKLP